MSFFDRVPDLTHTPGIYYAVSYWLYSMFFIVMSGKWRGSRWRRGLTSFLGLLGLGVFMVITDFRPQWTFIPLMAVIFTGICLFIGLSCEVNRRQAVYLGIRGFMLGEFAAALEWQLYYFFLTQMGLPLNMVTNLVFMLIIHTVVLLLTWSLETRFGGCGELELTLPFMGTVSAICLIAFLFSNLSFVFNNTPFSSQYPAEIFILRTLSDLLGVAGLTVCHILAVYSQERQRTESIESILSLQDENYRLARESVAIVSREYHDLKHLISRIRTCHIDEETARSLDAMEEQIRKFEAFSQTGNRVLSTIVTSKRMICQQEGISLHCVADGKAISFMDSTDISALFGSMLDNAMAAVRQIEKKDQRLIRLSVSRQRQFVRISLINRFEGELAFNNGLPVSDAHAHRLSGFGVRTIGSIVEKYGGSVRMEAEEGWFKVNILLPMGGGG